jgi:hypothetical protein
MRLPVRPDVMFAARGWTSWADWLGYLPSLTCTTPSLIPTVQGNTVRSFSTHGQQSAAKGSSTTISRSEIRLIQHLDSSPLGLVRRWLLLIGYFPIHLLPPLTSTTSLPLKPRGLQLG